MNARPLTAEDISYTSEPYGNMRHPGRVRAYGHLVGLSCVSHVIWVKEDYNEAVTKALMALELHRKLVSHLKKVERFGRSAR